jgi:hypothetical protein
MVRTQVYLSEEQHRALRRTAKREGLSMTALLRRIVERELSQSADSQGAEEAVMMIADLGRSGRSDISEKHDEALVEAFGDGRLR